jgi:hypothetical protein
MIFKMKRKYLTETLPPVRVGEKLLVDLELISEKESKPLSELIRIFLDKSVKDWKKVHQLIIVILLGLLVSSPASACFGAGAAGMGNAFMAVCDDSSVVYWAPDRLNRLKQTELSYSNSFGTYNYYNTITYVSKLDSVNVGIVMMERQVESGPDKRSFDIGVAFSVYDDKKYSLGFLIGMNQYNDSDFFGAISASKTMQNSVLTLRIDGGIRGGYYYHKGSFGVSYEFYYQYPYKISDSFSYSEYFETRYGVLYKTPNHVIKCGSIVHHQIAWDSVYYTFGYAYEFNNLGFSFAYLFGENNKPQMILSMNVKL